MPQMNSKTKSIGEIFAGTNKFGVPKHQRDYSWTDLEVEEFFSDIVGTMQRAKSDYYIGMLVLVVPDDSSSRYQILDGQQRLTTLSLIFASARDWCFNNGKTDESQRMQDDFIGFADYGQLEHDPRIVLNINNRDIFENYIVNRTSDARPANLEKTNFLLLESGKKCTELLNNYLGISKKKAEKLKKVFELVKFIRDKVQATVLEVNDPEDAYTIFESLNDRGLELSIFDLLKNHIYREMGVRKEALATQYWDRLSVNLRDRKPDEFIRIFWTIRHGRTQKGSLFGKIREGYSGPILAQDLIKQMADDAEIFSSIDSADGDVWSTHTDAIKSDIRAIGILGGNQARPILLAAIKKDWKDADLGRLTRAIVALVVRHQIVGRERTGALEIFCAELSHEIYKSSLGINKVAERIRNFYPNDERFMSDFKLFEETRGQRAKYFLAQIDIASWKLNNPNSAIEMAVIPSSEDVNVEHIFPKKYETNAVWVAAAKVHKELPNMTNMLGNQCLLAKGPNQRIGNKDFSEKKPVYEVSNILETKKLAGNAEWIPRCIKIRQEKMAVLAVGIWKA